MRGVIHHILGPGRTVERKCRPDSGQAVPINSQFEIKDKENGLKLKKIGIGRTLTLLMIMSLVLAACGGDDAPTTGGPNPVNTPAPTMDAGVGAEADPTATTGAPATDATQAATDATQAVTPGATGDGAVEASPCSDDAQGAQLNFWNPFTGPDGKFMGQLVARFNQENGKGVNVKMQTLPEYYSKLENAGRSNTLPDVAIVHADQVATQAATNILRPMPDEAIEFIGVGEDDFPAAVWAAGEYKDQRYSIPLDIHPMVMYYNKEMLQAAGIENPPTNREEYDQALAALAEQATGSKMAWSVTTGFPITQMFSQTLYQMGGTWFNDDGTEAAWNSDAGVQALQYLKTAQEKYAKPNLPVDAGVAAFKQGNVGIEWNGIWQISNLVTPHPFGAGAPVPQLGDTEATWAGSHQFTLTKQRAVDPKKDAAAACFISFISANSVEWAKGGQVPARNAVRESEAFQAVQPQAMIAPSAEFAFFPPNIAGINDAFAPLDQAVATYLQKGGDPKQMLDKAAQQANQILEANQRKYNR